MNYNQLLGVNHDASEADIQKAFRVAAMEIHPDHNNEPEAAEAFIRIREARDKLLEGAGRHEVPHDSSSAQQATAVAMKATANATYAAYNPVTAPVVELTAEEIAHIQELDELAVRYAKRTVLGRRNESEEVRRHRRKIKTFNSRINGNY